MLALLKHSPDIYLDEIQEQLQEQYKIDVSFSTISWTLKRLGISSKAVSSTYLSYISLFLLTFQKLSKIAAEHCEEAWHDFALIIGGEPPKYLVTSDEAAVNILTSYRLNGWSTKGLKAHKQCCFVCGTWYVTFNLIILHMACLQRTIDILFCLQPPWMELSIHTSRLVVIMVTNSWSGWRVSLPWWIHTQLHRVSPSLTIVGFTMSLEWRNFVKRGLLFPTLLIPHFA